MQVRGMSRAALLGAIVAALGLFVLGAIRLVAFVTEHTNTRTRTFAAAPTITVVARVGDVDIVGSDRPDVRLTTMERRSVWGGGHVKVLGDAARLRLDDGCDGVPSGVPFVHRSCRVRYRLEVPRDTALRVVDGTGAIRVEDLRGATDLHSSTGPVRATGVSGPLRVRADTGDVRVHVAAPDIAVRTGTGLIEIVASRPRRIQADTATGDIVVVVPALTYAVDARSEARGVRDLLRHDERSPRRLRAHTSAGEAILVSDPDLVG
jgi:hypothetical protein